MMFQALARLGFYHPEDYKRLRDGELKKRITEFVADERKLMPADIHPSRLFVSGLHGTGEALNSPRNC